MSVQYPMLFRLTNKGGPGGAGGGASTHVGVLDFTAPAGKIFVPHWVMANLGVSEGGVLGVRNVTLPKATSLTLRPHSVSFLDAISDPRAILERRLVTFAAVTIGDVLVLDYLGVKHALDVVDTKPGRAVCIVETDLNLEFAPPRDYVEPARKAAGGHGRVD